MKKAAAAKVARAARLQLPTAAGASLMLWFVLLAFGGGCLAWYYRSIHYFPRIEWHESLNYLALLSIVGGSLVVAFGLLAFLPGVIWSEVLFADPKLGRALRYNNNRELCIITISRVLGFPFAIFILLVHIPIVIGTILKSAVPFGLWLAVVLGSSLFASWIYVRQIEWALDREANRAAIRERAKQTRKAARERLAGQAGQGGPQELGEGQAEHDAQEASGAWECSLHSETKAKPDDQLSWGWLSSSRAKYLTAFLLSSGVGFVALLMMEGMLAAHDPATQIGMSALCAAVVVTANQMVAIVFVKRRGAAALVAALATLTLLVAGEGFEGDASLLHKVMAAYGVGEGSRYDLVVNGEGPALLAAQGVEVESMGGLGRVRNVAILSRLGDEFLFRCGKRTVSLPGNLVRSWSSAPPLVNADVIQGAKAQLTVDGASRVARIRAARSCDFDLSKGGSKILKDADVPAAVLAEMSHPSCASCTVVAAAGRGGSAPPAGPR
jgi:hypothetical protein